uniref:PPM-type phosphatase domain-containing protein n=1 Tax=Ditylenchus dipsaci TaxID=166011 RepID=A0A915E9H0_9BILA
MGAFLDHPKIKKENRDGGGNNAKLPYKWAASWMQGWRIDMEDAHFMHDSIPKFSNWSFFAVFDGHAGSGAAEYSEKNLLNTISETDEFKRQLSSRKDTTQALSEEELALVKSGLTKGFLKLDSDLQTKHEDGKQERERSGTTAVSPYSPSSHHILQFRRLQGSAMSKNYDPTSQRSLAVSRAFGDFEYKTVTGLPQNKQLVSPEPDVYVFERKPEEDEFVVLACDGVYDVLENDELCEIVRSRLLVCKELKEVTDQVLDICLSKGSRDNMTMILIAFDQAPKFDVEQFDEEFKWRENVKVKIEEYLERPDVKELEIVDAECVQNYLKEKAELDTSKPGGMHLCRPLIHAALERRPVPAGQAQTNEVDMS